MGEWDEQPDGTNSLDVLSSRRRLTDALMDVSENEPDTMTGMPSKTRLLDRISDDANNRKSGGPTEDYGNSDASRPSLIQLATQDRPTLLRPGETAGGPCEPIDPSQVHLDELRGQLRDLETPQRSNLTLKQKVLQGLLAAGKGAAMNVAAPGSVVRVQEKKSEESVQQENTLRQQIEAEQRAQEQRQFEQEQQGRVFEHQGELERMRLEAQGKPKPTPEEQAMEDYINQGMTAAQAYDKVKGAGKAGEKPTELQEDQRYEDIQTRLRLKQPFPWLIKPGPGLTKNARR